MGQTEYKFNFGETVGSKPTDLMNGLSYKQPIRDNPLKYGTNQLWSEIPNYQGFKPSGWSFNELQSKIEKRSAINRGDKKANLIENYHIENPGYAGHKPKFSSNEARIRQTCFGDLPKN